MEVFMSIGETRDPLLSQIQSTASVIKSREKAIDKTYVYVKLDSNNNVLSYSSTGSWWKSLGFDFIYGVQKLYYMCQGRGLAISEGEEARNDLKLDIKKQKTNLIDKIKRIPGGNPAIRENCLTILHDVFPDILDNPQEKARLERTGIIPDDRILRDSVEAEAARFEEMAKTDVV